MSTFMYFNISIYPASNDLNNANDHLKCIDCVILLLFILIYAYNYHIRIYHYYAKFILCKL